VAHNLNYNKQTGNYSFFSAKEKPWHSLGQIGAGKWARILPALKFGGFWCFLTVLLKTKTPANINLQGF
jgi:hypothetical protein